MNVRTAIPVAVAVGVIVVVLLALFGFGAAVSAVFGSLAVLVLPGAAIVAALFPRRTLEPVEAVLVTLLASVVVVILTGFLVTRFGIRLTPVSWAIAIIVVALAAAVTARLRGARLPSLPTEDLRPPANPLNLAVVAIAACVILAAGAVATLGAAAQPEPGFTQAWILPGTGSWVRFGLADDQDAGVSYRVVLRDAHGSLGEWTVRLRQGQRWERSMAVPAADRASVELLVYRADAPDRVYRRVGLGPTGSAAPSSAT